MAPDPVDSQIYTESSVVLSFASSAALPADAVLVMTMPDYMTDASYTYIQPGVSCLGVSNAGSVSCTYIGASKELKVSGIAPTGGQASGIAISIRINGFLMPASTSLYTGFKVSLLNGNNQKFNREDNVTLQAITPKTISNLVSTLPNNTVGFKGKLFFTITLPAPVLKDSKINISFTNFNIAACSMVSSIGLFSNNCTDLTITSQLLANQTITLILENIINNQETVDGTSLIQIFDSLGQISMKSNTVLFALAEQIIYGLLLAVNPPRLGATGKLQAGYKTEVGYKSGAQFKLTMPSQVSLNVPIQCYFMDLLVTCSQSGSVVSFMISNAVAANATVKLELSSVVLPACNGDYSLQVQVDKVESGTVKLANLAVSALSGSAVIHNSSTAWSDAEYSLKLTYPSSLFKDSEIKLGLPTELLWQALSTCTISGLDIGATCSRDGNNAIKVTGATGLTRGPGGSFDIMLRNFTNPRIQGQFPLTFSVTSSSCTYMTLSVNLAITLSAQWESAVLEPNKKYLSTFHSLSLTFNPPKTPLSGDKIMLKSLPVLKATTQSVNSAINYASSLNISYFLSPAQASVVSFSVSLVDSSGQTVLNTIKPVQYDIALPGTSYAKFGSMEKGMKSTITAKVSIESYLPSQSKVMITLSKNFSDFSNIELINSKPSGSIQIDLDNRKVYFILNEENPSSSEMTINLSLMNPQIAEISADEIRVSVLTSTNTEMFSILPFTNSIKFICAIGCLTCESLANVCKTCEAGLILQNENRCIVKNMISSAKPKYPPIFIFPILSIVIVTVCLVMYKVDRLSHPMNMAYYANRLLFVCWMIVSMVVFFVYVGRTQGGLTLLIFLMSIVIAIGSSCLDKPKTKAEKTSWLVGIGSNRHGVVGFGKGSQSGWRNLKDMTNEEGKKESNQVTYLKWKNKNTLLCTIAVVAINIPSIVLGIMTFVSYTSFYIALEMMLMSFLDAIIFVTAWIELNRKDKILIIKSQGLLLRKGRAGNKHSNSDDELENAQRNPNSLSKKSYEDNSSANLLDDTAKVIMFPLAIDHQLDLPQGINDTNRGDCSDLSDSYRVRFDNDEEVGDGAMRPRNDSKSITGKLLSDVYQPPNSDSPTDRLGYRKQNCIGNGHDEYQNMINNKGLQEDLLKIDGLDNLNDTKSNIKSKKEVSREEQAKLIENFVKRYASEENLLDNNSQEGSREFSKKDTRDLDSEGKSLNKINDDPHDNDYEYSYFNPKTGLFEVRQLDDDNDDSKKPTSKFITALKKMPLVPSKGINMLELNEYVPDKKVKDSSGNLIDPSKIPLHTLKKNADMKNIGYCADKTDPYLALKNTPINTIPIAPSKEDKATILSLTSPDHDSYSRKPFNDSSLDSTHFIKFPSSKAVLDEGNIRQASRYWKNQHRNRLNCSPYYLEVIYEEAGDDDGRPSVAENPVYDNPVLERLSRKMAGTQGQMKVKNLPEKVKKQMIKELVSLLQRGKIDPRVVAKRSEEVGIGGLGHLSAFLKSTDKLEVNEDLEPVVINGQSYQNIVVRNIEFLDGRHLPLEDQDPDLLERGIYKDNLGEELYLGLQDPQNIRRGLIVTPGGEIVQISKLRAVDLVQDIWRKPETGVVTFVNGQPTETMNKLVILDKNGQKVNIRKQDRKDMLAGKITTESGNLIDLGCPQDKNLLERGLFISKDGIVRRIADNDWNTIQDDKENQTIGRDLDTGKFNILRDEEIYDEDKLKDMTPQDMIEFELKKNAKKEKFKEFFGINDVAVAHREKHRGNEKINGENNLYPNTGDPSKLNTYISLQDEVETEKGLTRRFNKRITKKFEMSEGHTIDSKSLANHIRRDHLSSIIIKADTYKFNNKADNDLMARDDLPGPKKSSHALKKDQARPDSPEPETLTVNLVNEHEDSFDLSVNVQEGNDKVEGTMNDTDSKQRRTVDGSRYNKFNDGSVDDLKSEFNFTGLNSDFKHGLYQHANFEELQALQKQKKTVEGIAKRHLGLGDQGNDEYATIMGIDESNINRANRTSNSGRLI